ncbi:MAG: sulfatase-like hydrolase/transferase [Kiritimatiellia bacterium]|jgi:arylsulfatase A-like enzyme
MPDRPNILFIHADQHRFDCVGANGHPLPITPNLDRLAAEGMNFTRAFTPSPICVPERNSLLHGCWPSRHLCLANQGTEAPRPPDDELPTWSRALHDAGYALDFLGQWHDRSDRDPLHPAYAFDTFFPDAGYGAWRAAQGLPPRPLRNRWFGETDEAIRPGQSRLAWVADAVIERLRARAADPSRPFLLRWDPVEPHLPNVVPEPYASRFDPARIPPWGSFGDPLENKPAIQRQQLLSWKLDGRPWEEWAPTVARYLGEISLLDAQVGRVLDELRRLGIEDKTLVIYTCDHGDLCGSHGMIDKHYVMYDDVTHVPLLARWPGRIPPGSTCTDFVSHALDLAATFVDLAGAHRPSTFQGMSLAPVFAGGRLEGRDAMLSQYFGNQFGLFSQRMLRDKRWKYVWNPVSIDELYDLETDPWERVNRASDPTCADELARLRKRLAAWLEDIGDPLLNGFTRVQLEEGRKL